MNDPRVELQAALKEAMQQKDAMRRDVLRMSLNAIKQIEIDERRTLNAEEAMVVLQKEVKKRRESIDEARKAGRDDIAATEAEQIVVLEQFLPRQLDRDEVTALASEAIAETGATSAKDTGKVMSALMPKVRGLADGKLVNDVVRSLLN
ncbi:MAG TPA: GatB/YqeY domain-containing protein [Candidatus Limnocylindrales bacterium]|nr:GatB/YqeY domain-containing protein [Candidatus Limnocylindrales bacterium]